MPLFIDDVPALAFIAFVAAVVVFPLVFIASFLYDWLVERYPKAPKVLLMFACTLFASVVAVFVVYAYLGVTLTELLAR